MARHAGNADLLFLNYGYLEAADDALEWVRREDRFNRYHLNLLRRLLGDLPLTGRRVLEVGAGRGGNCLFLARYTGAEGIVGVDPCRTAAHLARRFVPDRQVRFLAAAAESLPLASGSVELVLSVSALHDYRDVGRFTREAERVLAPGGRLYCTDFWGVRQLPYDWEAMEAALYGSSLELLGEEDISRGVFLAIAQEDGIIHRLRAAAEPGSRELIERLCRLTEALGATLAFGECSYRIWRFRKPGADAFGKETSA